MTNTNDPKKSGTRTEGTVQGGTVRDALAYADYQRLLGDSPSFWEALCAFRAEMNDPEPLDIDPKSFPRDRSPGRPVDLS